ncbi:MAG TPA: Holliday junction branch migration protein RuvA [Polyangiaceae bacterium]|nr:Holliday junction branch migration protein RuvA [Polyangiaceae bacterium]
MIGRLTGRVAAQEADAVVLDVGGVGYELAVPMGTLGRARGDEGGRITLWVHTHVREDALSLFGFADETERAAFRALLAVSNVGPKIAVAVLGALPAEELALTVARRDLAALTAVSGVGKKIAERLLLELRDKLPSVPTRPLAPAAGQATPGGGADAEERLRSALTGMGFKPSEAERAVSAIGERARSAPMPELLREALATLAR